MGQDGNDLVLLQVINKGVKQNEPFFLSYAFTNR